MRTKPTATRPVIVCKVKHVWRGMFMAYWDDRLNYPRQLSALFRRIDGVWTTLAASLDAEFYRSTSKLAG